MALAEQTDLARVPYARDLLEQVLESRGKAASYMLERALLAFEVTDRTVAIELARRLFETLGPKSLSALVATRLVRFVLEALDELVRQARNPQLERGRRFEAARAVLDESQAMRIEGTPSADIKERATEALDVIIEIASEPSSSFRDATLELLGEESGSWRAALDPIDAIVLKATLYEAGGQFANAASELARAFHATLDVDDEWALGKAEALLEDIHALGGDDAVSGLRERLAQYQEVFERRSQSGLVIPPTIDPADLYGLVLVVGGNETQSQQDVAIAEANPGALAQHHAHLRAHGVEQQLGRAAQEDGGRVAARARRRHHAVRAHHARARAPQALW